MLDKKGFYNANNDGRYINKTRHNTHEHEKYIISCVHKIIQIFIKGVFDSLFLFGMTGLY